MLATSRLLEFLWEAATEHAAYVQNLSFTKFIPNSTPYQLWTGRKPNIAHLQEFGAPVWVLAEGQRVLHKMLPKSHQKVYVGYNDSSKSVKYYNTETRSILTS